MQTCTLSHASIHLSLRKEVTKECRVIGRKVRQDRSNIWYTPLTQVCTCVRENNNTKMNFSKLEQNRIRRADLAHIQSAQYLSR